MQVYPGDVVLYSQYGGTAVVVGVAVVVPTIVTV